MFRIGVVGYGLRVSQLIKEIFRPLESDMRIVGVVDPDEAGVRERLEECDRNDVVFYKSLDKMIRKGNLDGLMIGTRCDLHTKYAIEAAKYDIPLYLEKPVSINMRQITALEKAYRKTSCKVVVSFPLRVSPLCQLAHQLIHVEGAVGTPEHVHAVNYVNYGTVYWEKGYREFDVTQGLFLQKATHDLDYLSYLMGSPIVRVAAMANYGRVFGGKKSEKLICSKCKEQDDCLESPQNRKQNQSGGILEDHLCVFSKACGTSETDMNEDCSSTLLEFANGTHGVYSQVFFARRDAAARGATVSGYEGTVSFDWYTNELKRVRHHSPFTDVSRAGEGMSHFGGDTELARDFFNVIRGKGKSRTPIQTGLASVYACLAAKESAKKGKFVRVRQVEI